MSAIVVLIDASGDAVCDGAQLAGHLGCRVHSYHDGEAHDPQRIAATLAGEDPRLVLFVVEADTVQGVARVSRVLPPTTTRLYVGRGLADPALQRRVKPGDADGVVVGEPYLTVGSVLRTLRRGGELTGSIPGLLIPGARLAPRGPLVDLDRIPAAAFGDLPQEVALQVPLRPSRGHPHACLFSAERAWESPVRRRSVPRVIEELRLHAADGARIVRFTDLCLNTSGAWLLDLCTGLVQAGLQLRWYGRIWPDPLLDRAAVRLLRRSGCRGLEVDLFTGSACLGQALATGVDPRAAGELVRRCHGEGIRARVQLVSGCPGEQDVDRTATMAWLEANARWLRGISSLATCWLREGAPLRRSARVHLPADGDPAGWHDGGENNPSQRRTWVRELALWVDDLALPRPAGERSLSGETARGARRRLQGRVEEHQATDAGWIEDHLLEAGLLHGREAYRGPTTVELDMDGMPAATVAAVLEQAAGLGTRRVVLGRRGEDALLHPALEAVLEQAAALDLSVTLRSPLTGVQAADDLRPVARNIGRLEVEVPPGGPGWDSARRWLSALAADRAGIDLPLPRLDLVAVLDREHADLDLAVEGALCSGVDRLVLGLRRGESGRMTGAQRRAARAALQARLDATIPGDGEEDALLVPSVGWPGGFRLVHADAGIEIVCPAGLAAQRVRRVPSDPGALQAAFEARGCRRCELLGGCPVDRDDYHVRLGLCALERPGWLLDDLGQEDLGLGQRGRWMESHPCFVAWDVARIDVQGRLFACPECGNEPVADVLVDGLGAAWYGRALNELRHMTRTAARVLPHVDRGRCGDACRRARRNVQLLGRLEALGPVRRRALEELGADRRRA